MYQESSMQTVGRIWPQPVSARRLAAAKRAFVTRRIDLGQAGVLLTGAIVPRPGDLVLARVETLGQHRKLETPEGRRVQLYAGDEILVAYGNRYAPDQFESHVPATLGPCDLVASGGIASEVRRRSGKVRAATRIVPLGILADGSGTPLNVAGFALPQAGTPRTRPVVVAVVGSSMNAGKTTTLGALVHGASRAGLRVGACKVTGTGSGNDTWVYRDAGAEVVMDFTDAGHATTHLAGAEAIGDVFEGLLDRMAAEGMEVVLVEVADGLLLDETADLLTSRRFRDRVDGIVFAGADAMGTLSGEAWLRVHDLPVVALSGAFTQSPLSVAEVEARTSLPILTLEAMQSGVTIATDLVIPKARGLASCAA
jgi:hypothetical protein